MGCIKILGHDNSIFWKKNKFQILRWGSTLKIYILYYIAHRLFYHIMFNTKFIVAALALAARSGTRCLVLGHLFFLAVTAFSP